jgi:phospholipase/carboxylesterase
MDFPLDHRRVDPDDPGAPTVLLLHGRGADEDDLLGLADHLPDAHLLSVRAPDPLGPGYTWYALEGADGPPFDSTEPDEAEFERSREALDRFVDAAVEAYGVEPPVGVLGFSQGAILGMSSLLDSPDLYGWVAALHGYLPADYAERGDDAFPDAAGRGAFLAGGSADQVIPAPRTERAADRLRAFGLEVTYEAYETGHGIGREELADMADWVQGR